MAERRMQIAVSGAGKCDEAVSQLAEEVGKEIARKGAVLVCGGLGGVMEAAARGARAAGGLTVGILPSYDRQMANPWVEVIIPSGLGQARNVLVAASGDALIALPGEHGTASEIALALKLGRRVVTLGAWDDCEGAFHAESPKEAVATAIAVLEGG